MEALRDLVRRRFPGHAVVSCDRLGDDERPDDATRKGSGYGVPVRVVMRDPDGRDTAMVFHTARSDDFGHDRRADRAAQMLLAFDTYGAVPRHVAAVDVGVVTRDGQLRSIADADEVYLLTGWQPGELYAQDLRRITTDGATARDHQRLDVLADYLAQLHRRDGARPAVYTRAVRDLVGAGEGIFGMIDSYAADVPAAPPARLRRLEERCVGWRWRLRGREPRVARIHGDFHPFNILFAGEAELALLDASRGAVGEPADDVTALAINFVFFALDAPGAWHRGLGALWHRLWSRYLIATDDPQLLEVAAPWLAWRALVIANPRWYPNLSATGRDRLLTWVEHALDAARLDPRTADEVLA
jgi:aminoglycoside phosphotransferase (APT) family kinase protein